MRATFTAHGAVSGFTGPAGDNPMVGLTDVHIADVDGQLMLFVAGRGSGSVTGFEIGPQSGDMIEAGSWTIPESFLRLERTDLVTRVLDGGGVEVLLPGLDSDDLRGVTVTSEGGDPVINNAFGLTSENFDAADIVEMAIWDEGDLAVVGLSGGGIAIVDFTNGPGITLEPVVQTAGISDVIATDIVLTTTPTGDRIVVVSYGDADAVGLFKTDETGNLTHVADVTAQDGFWVNHPGEMVITTGPDGKIYVVVASSGTGSLTVLHVSDDAEDITVIEHVIDSLDTRFHEASFVTTVTMNGQDFILAAGSDAGISLFGVLAGGRLQHIETIAGEVGSPLGGISGLTAVGTPDGIRIFVSTQSEPFLVEYDLTLEDQGISEVGSAGGDTMSGSHGDDILQGLGGDDVISGGQGDDILMGGAGADSLWGGAGADVFIMSGGTDKDTILDFDPSQDTLDLSGMSLIGGLNNLVVTPTPWGAILLFGGVTFDVHSWNGASLSEADFGTWNVVTDNRILVAPDEDDPSPEPDPDPDPVPNMPETKDAGPKPDAPTNIAAPTPQVPIGPADLQGTPGADTLTSASTSDVIYGGSGGDTITSGAGQDTVTGDDGADHLEGQGDQDVLFGGSGFDTLYGGKGEDTLDGGTQADYLSGGLDDDVLVGGQGADKLFGGAGHDSLWSGSEADRLYGGDGDDWMNAGTSSGFTVDGLWGGSGDDTMFGDLGFDMLDGGDGNDVMDGGRQADNLFGGAGDDILFGDQGLDRLFGGDGTDLLMGGVGTDGLFGGAGNDVAWGGDDNDRAFGGIGDDILLGEAGNDTLYGGAGFDVIEGGIGDDLLFGNFNADRFVFKEDHGHDTIYDFAATNIYERIDFAGFDGFSSTQDVLNAATQVGDNVLIITGTSSSIELLSVDLADLGADDFLF